MVRGSGPPTGIRHLAHENTFFCLLFISFFFFGCVQLAEKFWGHSYPFLCITSEPFRLLLGLSHFLHAKSLNGKNELAVIRI